MNTVTIAGWNINIDHFNHAKSLTQLKKNDGLFDNLSKEEKEEAFKQLWEVIKPQKEEDMSDFVAGEPLNDGGQVNDADH